MSSLKVSWTVKLIVFVLNFSLYVIYVFDRRDPHPKGESHDRQVPIKTLFWLNIFYFFTPYSNFFQETETPYADPENGTDNENGLTELAYREPG